MNEKQAIEILAECINKVYSAFNKSEQFAIQQAFTVIQQKLDNGNTDKTQ